MRYACIGIAIIFAIVRVDSHGWGIHPRQGHFQGYPQNQPINHRPSPGYPQFVEGTLDQLNTIEAQWVCTNQKSGDMVVFGTENMHPVNNRYPGQGNGGTWQNQRPTYNPEPPYQPQPQQPQVPVGKIPVNIDATSTPLRPTSIDAFEKFDNFDRTAYHTTTNAPKLSQQVEFDGQGILEPRIG